MTIETPESIEAFHESLLEWADGNMRDFPWRRTTNPYEVLVAEILLGATLAVKVVPIFEEFLKRYPTPEALAEADEAELADLLEPLGLQNRRASAFESIAQDIQDEGIPNTEEELLELPYVGRYAANATLCFAFERDRPVVDDNVARVYNRAFDVDLKPESNAAWEFAGKVLPEKDVQKYNLALLDFGALICTSGTPKCSECFYSFSCSFYEQVNGSRF